MAKALSRNPLKPKGFKIFAFLSIPVALYLFVIIFPLIFAIVFSFFRWSGGPRKTFMGLANYIELFNDPIFWVSFKNTMLFTVLMVVGQVGIAFLLSLVFTMKWIKFVEFHRRVMFFPNVIAAVVIGLMWQLIYNKDYGILNLILESIGAQDLIRLWLDDPDIVMFSVAVPVIWQYIGYYLVILMSAVAAIPKEIFEVAEIDGASGFKKSVYITIPLIWNSVKICVMICVAGSFKAFDHIMVMTGGGPGRSTSVLSLYNYDISFSQMRLGYACAMAVIILIISFVLTMGTRALMSRGDKNEN